MFYQENTLSEMTDTNYEIHKKLQLVENTIDSDIPEKNS